MLFSPNIYVYIIHMYTLTYIYIYVYIYMLFLLIILFVVGVVGTRIEPEPSPCSSRHAHMGIAPNTRQYSCVQQAIIAREYLPNSLGCREAPTVNMSFLKPENLEDASLLEVEAPEAPESPEAAVSFRMKRSTLKKMAVGVATAMVVCVGMFAL